jgi:regulator of sigma E protease
MDFLSILPMHAVSLAMYVVAFIVALTIIVFIHELGHFLVARWCGVSVEAFSIGFGKEITGWHDKHGTRWKLCWIPLGGYVKFKGDANAASLPDAETVAKAVNDPGNFHGKPVWQRAAVVAAGPIANFILAIFIFAVGFMAVGLPMVEPRVGEVLQGSAADKAGIQKGDLIVMVEGAAIPTFDDLVMAVIARGGDELTMQIDRGGSKINLVIVPNVVEEADGKGGKIRKGQLGVTYDPAAVVNFERLGPVAAVSKGIDRSWFIVSTTFRYLGKLFTGRESADQLGGPLSIAQVAGDAASAGVFQFITMIAFLSVSIGLINLFPIPMLDGGHLVYYAIEAVRGKPLGEGAQEWGFRIGFSIVIMMMVVGTWNDVLRYINRAFGS